MVDVATVARSMAYATGYTLGEWEEMQRWVNDHNRRRGYMDEPEWEEMISGTCQRARGLLGMESRITEQSRT